MTVNGEGVNYRLDPETPLLWALRDGHAQPFQGFAEVVDSGSAAIERFGRALGSDRRFDAVMLEDLPDDDHGPDRQQ